MKNIYYQIKYALENWNWLQKLICKIKGHHDVIWFNPNGLEPDMHCKRCGEDLG